MNREEYLLLVKAHQLLQNLYETERADGIVDTGNLAVAADALEEVVYQMADHFEADPDDDDDYEFVPVEED